MNKGIQAFLTGTAVAALSASGSATLLPSQVLVLYNSQVPQTVTLKNAYVAAHPGVLTFDINVSHPILTPPWTTAYRPPPDSSGMNNFFITKSRFNELFVSPSSAYQQYMSAHPEIRAIATMRGLPAAVTNDQFGENSVFNPFPNHGPGPGINTPVMSFEGALAVRTPTLNGQVHTNNYYASRIGISEYFTACGSTGVFNDAPGTFFLVTRLDSGTPIPPVDVDGNEVIDEYDGVLALINRSAQPIPVSKYSTNALIDLYSSDPRTGVSSPGIILFPMLERQIWDSHWPVLADRGPRFLHGPYDGGADVSVPSPPTPPPSNALYFNENFLGLTDGDDSAFTQAYPTVFLATLGRNHSYWNGAPNSYNGEPLHWNYVQAYWAHPGGYLFHHESFGGWSLHSPGFIDTEGVRQGQGLDWIAIGGSFARSRSIGSYDTDSASVRIFFHNFYVAGMTFAEAAYSAERFTGHQTCLGDPLGRVIVYDADVVLDRVIDQSDIDAVLNASTPRADVNLDGFINSADLILVQKALGRDFTSPPASEPTSSPLPAPFAAGSLHPLYADPQTRCRGDITGDGLTDDLDITLALGTLWPGSWCLRADVNLDYQVTSADLAVIIANDGVYHVDFNNNNVLDSGDFALLCAQMFTVDSSNPACGSLPPPYTCTGWDARFDLNCDGIVNCVEYNFLVSLFDGTPPTCSSCP